MTNSTEGETWLQFRDTVEQYYSTDATWINSSALSCLATAYSVLILTGMAGNLLVLTAILRRSEMRVARNVFIANLAVSDLCLCAVTMPLTFTEIVYQRWQWGDSQLLCHLQAPIQLLFVIISSLSISAIATDRYLTICSPLQNLSLRSCLASLPCLWLLGLSLSVPLGVYRRLLSTGESLVQTAFPFSSMVELYSTYSRAEPGSLTIMTSLANRTVRSNQTDMYQLKDGQNTSSAQVESEIVEQVEVILCHMGFPEGKIVTHAECIEIWPSSDLEQMYTWTVTLLQFLLPLTVAGFSNASIYLVIKERLTAYTARSLGPNRLQEIHKMKRTMKLLIFLVTIFLVCWLPLTLFNLAHASIREMTNDNVFFSTFAVCHLFGMTSACLNPVLYGFLNESYKAEFQQMAANITGRKRKRTNELRTEMVEMVDI